jgi:hypothetical protein
LLWPRLPLPLFPLVATVVVLVPVMVMVMVMVTAMEGIGHVATGGIPALGIAKGTGGYPGDVGSGYQYRSMRQLNTRNPCRADVSVWISSEARGQRLGATKAMRGFTR